MGRFHECAMKIAPVFVKINTGVSVFFILNIFLAYYLFEEKIREYFKKNKKVYFKDVIGVDEYLEEL